MQALAVHLTHIPLRVIICITSIDLSFELSTQVLLQGTSSTNKLYISSILYHSLLVLELHVVLAGHIREAPLLRDNDFLTAGELVPCTAESLLDDSSIGFFATDREDDLADVDTGDSAVGLTPSTTHTGLQPISTSTTQHLVDTDNVEWVHTDAHVERILARCLGDILVSANTSCFERLRAQLLILIGDKMTAEGELVDGGTFTAEVKNPDFRIRDTTVVP